jgi:hypothetical protein
MANDHKARLLSIVGQTYYDILMKGVDSDLERYGYLRQSYINSLDAQGINESTAKQLVKS